MKYKAKADCFIFGAYRPAGSVFTGPELKGYDLETATHLEALDNLADEHPVEEHPASVPPVAPKRSTGKKINKVIPDDL